VRLTRGELRLLLATRRRPGRDRHDPAPDPAGSATLTLVKPQPSDES
jgi:hypothetical protein